MFDRALFTDQNHYFFTLYNVQSMHLAHLRLPLTSYSHAARIQEKLVQRLLAYKASSTADDGHLSMPAPTILTAQFHPIYTTGRRDRDALTIDQEAHLRATGAEVHRALRGGQTTFHGPGQLVAYPILDLKRHGLYARSYIRLLEEAVIHTCAHYGVNSHRTENPGVWTSDDEKICALGVHLRRNVTSHGIGLNVDTDLGWFKRIVACGLDGKWATSLKECGVKDANVDEVASAFVRNMGSLLGIQDVEDIGEDVVDL